MLIRLFGLEHGTFFGKLHPDMRFLPAIVALITFQSYVQGIDDSKLREEPALGGIADYDPLLFMMFFEADEVEAIIADPKNEEYPVRADISVKRRFSGSGMAQVKLNPPKPKKEKDVLASVQSPNYVRGYILLGNNHRNGFSSYDLYYEDGD